jgi:type 1 fimbria pilin
MRKLAALSIALLLCIAVAGPSAADDEKTVTLEGTVVCAKCTLHVEEQAKCHNVLLVGEKGKERRYYLTKNDVYEEFGDVCMATPTVRITGKIEEKEGRDWLTASEIVQVTEES